MWVPRDRFHAVTLQKYLMHMSVRTDAGLLNSVCVGYFNQESFHLKTVVKYLNIREHFKTDYINEFLNSNLSSCWFWFPNVLGPSVKQWNLDMCYHYRLLKSNNQKKFSSLQFMYFLFLIIFHLYLEHSSLFDSY